MRSGLRPAELAERVKEKFGFSVHSRSVERALAAQKKPPEVVTLFKRRAKRRPSTIDRRGWIPYVVYAISVGKTIGNLRFSLAAKATGGLRTELSQQRAAIRNA